MKKTKDGGLKDLTVLKVHPKQEHSILNAKEMNRFECELLASILEHYSKD